MNQLRVSMHVTQPRIFASSDYIGIEIDGFRAYYGYEEINEQKEWCFTVNERGEPPFKVSYRALLGSRNESMFDVEKIFLKGLAIWINQKINNQSMKAIMEQLLAKSQS